MPNHFSNTLITHVIPRNGTLQIPKHWRIQLPSNPPYVPLKKFLERTLIHHYQISSLPGQSGDLVQQSLQREGRITELQSQKDPQRYLGVISSYLHFIDGNNETQKVPSLTSHKQSTVGTQTSFVWLEAYAIWGTLI